MKHPVLSVGCPDLALEYTDTRRPADAVTLGSQYKADWTCRACGYAWQATVASRVRGRGCPSCSGHVVGTRESLAQTHPDIAAQWRSTDLSPRDVTHGSHTVARWECEQGHEWEASVLSRTSGRGCPVCTGKRVVAGINDLATLRPDLAAQWADARDIQSVALKSNYSARWKCAEGHQWQAVVASRTRSEEASCPSCREVSKEVAHLFVAWEGALARWRCERGHEWLSTPFEQQRRSHPCQECRSVAVLHPELVREWADERSAARFTVSSREKVQWRCPKGHLFFSTVASRVGGSGCTVCSNRLILAGVNDMWTVDPLLAEELTDPQEGYRLGAGSTLPTSWSCPDGHTYTASPDSRRRGTGCPVCANVEVRTGINDLASLRPDLAAEWADARSILTVSIGSAHVARWRCEKGHLWETAVYCRTRTPGTGCPECAARSYSSRFEQEIAAFIRTVLGADDAVETGVRRFRRSGVTEFDIYVASANVAVEANGIYWHSEAGGKTKFAHAEKQAAAEKLGIQLIQVWEDDWTNRRAIVERALAHKLGVSREPVIPTRKTVARPVTLDEARSFLDENHIQGFTGASYYIGLEFEGQLVAVLSLKRTGSEGELRLERFATSARVPGAQSKLIRFAERTIDWSYLITFADREVSDGNLYEKTGWVRDGEVAPDYKYVVNGRRVHKFNYRLKRFRDDPTLKFEEGRTERELAALNKLARVWDSGKIRYRYSREREADC